MSMLAQEMEVFITAVAENTHKHSSCFIRNARLRLGNLIKTILMILTFLIGFTIASTYSAYIMGYFKDSSDSSSTSLNLHLAVSTDGLTWVPLNQNTYVLKPTMGTRSLRDPFFYRMHDGTFTIVATDNWNSEYIHIWSSTDLRTFSNERLFRVNTAGMHAWAPEIFYDNSGSQYAIIWSGNSDRNRIYVNYTKDFSSVSTPKVFFDPGFSVIDGHMEVGINGNNYLYYKGETDFKLYGTRSSTLNPGSFDENTYTIGYGTTVDKSHTVGPILVKCLFSPNTWWLWGESPIPVNAVFYAWQTDDLSSDSWKSVDNRNYTTPPNASHATIVPITSNEYKNLISKWGIPSWDLIKSYKHSSCYIRHENLVGKISSPPFAFIADMQWRIVPGLADPNGISFKSVNITNCYLRHRNFSLILSENDSTVSFNSDATFYNTVGFADSCWTSFKSYNYPQRYIRISVDSTLRIDTITDNSAISDKEDATFKVVYSSIRQNITALKEDYFKKVIVHKNTKTGIIYRTQTSIALNFHKSIKLENAQISLFDVSGRLALPLYTGRLSHSHMVLPLDRRKINPGIYVVNVSSNNSKRLLSEQIIISR